MPVIVLPFLLTSLSLPPFLPPFLPLTSSLLPPISSFLQDSELPHEYCMPDEIRGARVVDVSTLNPSLIPRSDGLGTRT